jgi:Raf kinase inhibitor-like YbhB/YbcL family protein
MRAIEKMLIISVAITAFAQQPATSPKAPEPPGLTLTTTAFEDSAIMPKGVAGSPKLEWTNVPAGVVSFALIMHDPDTAPDKKSEDVLHWMVFNIPGTATRLPEGVPATVATLTDGTIQAKNWRGRVGFMGPGANEAGPYHHYTWELFALDIRLSLGPDASRADVLKAMDGHIVAKAALVGRFHK